MEITRHEESSIIHLNDLSEYFDVQIYAPGAPTIRVDTIHIAEDTTAVEGRQRGLWLSKNRISEASLSPDAYQDRMPEEVYIAASSLYREVNVRAQVIRDRQARMEQTLSSRGLIQKLRSRFSAV